MIDDYRIASKFDCYELAIAELLVLFEQSQRMVKRPKYVYGESLSRASDSVLECCDEVM